MSSITSGSSTRRSRSSTSPRSVSTTRGHSPTTKPLELTHVHPKLIYRRQVCANPFYRTPEQLTDPDDIQLSAQRVFQAAYELSTARGHRRREQRVGILDRVLRHNLRNEMNIIQSHAELIDAATDDPDSVATIPNSSDPSPGV